METYLQSNEFIEENEREKAKSKRKGKDTALEITPCRLRIKYKFIRNQWRKFTDRVKKSTGKAPIVEPDWFTILSPVFPPQQPTHSMYPYGGVNMTQYQFDQSQVPTTHNTTLTELEPPSSNSWYEHN